MRRYLSLFVFGVLLSSLFVTLSLAAPGSTYSIIGDNDFTSPEAGHSFTATEFDFLSQVTDKNTGKFYWEGAGAVGSSAGNLELRPDVTNVGIGTPPSAKLHIKGDNALGTSASLYIQNEAGTTDADLMVVQNDGKVGIGTAGPAETLHVDGEVRLTLDGVDSGDNFVCQNGSGNLAACSSSGNSVWWEGVNSQMGGWTTDRLTVNNTTYRKLANNDTQFLYIPDQTDFANTMILGTAGDTLSHTAGLEGQNNTIVGLWAAPTLSTGTSNTIVGSGSVSTGDGNSFFGELATGIAVTGDYNTALGFNAGNSLTSESNNIFIGKSAGDNVSGGSNNIAIGSDIDLPTASASDQLSIGNLIFATGGFGTGATVGAGNVGIGVADPQQKLHVNGIIRTQLDSAASDHVCIDADGDLSSCTATTASQWEEDGTTTDMLTVDNTSYRKLGNNGTQFLYVPDQTGFAGTLVLGNGGGSLSHSTGEDGQKNTIVGIGAGNSMTTGESNTTLGYNALNSVTTGSINIAIGENAVKNNTTSVGNVGVGAFSLHYTTSGSNIGIGTSAGAMITTGEDNIAIGGGALSHATTNKTGSGNIAIGTGMTGGSLTSGTDNIIIGNSIGGITTGSNNILIGDLLSAQSSTADDQLSIGNLIFGSGGFGQGTNVGVGNVGIGVADPQQKLHVGGKTRINDLTNTGTKLVTADGKGVLGGDAWLCQEPTQQICIVYCPGNTCQEVAEVITEPATSGNTCSSGIFVSRVMPNISIEFSASDPSGGLKSCLSI